MKTVVAAAKRLGGRLGRLSPHLSVIENRGAEERAAEKSKVGPLQQERRSSNGHSANDVFSAAQTHRAITTESVPLNIVTTVPDITATQRISLSCD